MGMLADEDRARSPSVDPLWISADSWWKSPNKEGAPPVPLHLPLDGIPSNASTIVQPANRIRTSVHLTRWLLQLLMMMMKAVQRAQTRRQTRRQTRSAERGSEREIVARKDQRSQNMPCNERLEAILE